MSEQPKRWWETMPAILGGIAAVIGAIATLVTLVFPKESVEPALPPFHVIVVNPTYTVAAPPVAPPVKEDQPALAVQQSPVVEYKTMNWDYIVNSNRDDQTKCRNQFGELVGDWRSCYSDGTCNNAPAIVAMCRTLYGAEFEVVNSVRVKN